MFILLGVKNTFDIYVYPNSENKDIFVQNPKNEYLICFKVVLMCKR